MFEQLIDEWGGGDEQRKRTRNGGTSVFHLYINIYSFLFCFSFKMISFINTSIVYPSRRVDTHYSTDT